MKTTSVLRPRGHGDHGATVERLHVQPLERAADNGNRFLRLYHGKTHMTIMQATSTETGFDHAFSVDTHKHTPILTFTREDIENRSASGNDMDAITIDIIDGNKKTRFFVDLHINRGRVCIHTATNVGNATKYKRLFGEWR